MSATPNPYPWDQDTGTEPPEGAVEIIAGRTAPFSQLGDWVFLAGVPAPACKLYWIYMAHVNTARGDAKVWPKREDIAEMLGASVDTVDRCNKALSKLGAIDIVPRRYGNGMRARNAYRVHMTPPPGYTGKLSIADFYAAKRNSA